MSKRKQLGRPPLKVKPKKARMVYISDEAYQFYKKLGDNNFSKGIEIASKQN